MFHSVAILASLSIVGNVGERIYAHIVADHGRQATCSVELDAEE